MPAPPAGTELVNVAGDTGLVVIAEPVAFSNVITVPTGNGTELCNGIATDVIAPLKTYT